MALNLQDLTNHVAHDIDNTGTLSNTDLDPATVGGVRYNARRAKADGFATVDETTGMFTGAKTGTQDVTANLDSLAEFREASKELKEAGVSGRTSETLLRDQQRIVDRSARSVLSDAGKSVAEHEKALVLLEEQENKVKQALGKRVIQEQKVIAGKVAAMPGTTAAEISAKAASQTEMSRRLLANHSAALDAVKDHFVDQRLYHTDNIKALHDIGSEVEKETGISKSEYFKKAGATGVEAKTATTVAADGAKEAGLLAKLGKMSFAGKAVGLIGVGSMISGAMDLVQGFQGGVNDKGEATPPDSAKQGMGLVKAGAGAIATWAAAAGKFGGEALMAVR